MRENAKLPQAFPGCATCFHIHSQHSQYRQTDKERDRQDRHKVTASACIVLLSCGNGFARQNQKKERERERESAAQPSNREKPQA